MAGVDTTILSGKVGPLAVRQDGVKPSRPHTSGKATGVLSTIQLQPPGSSSKDRVTAVGCSSCGASVGLATAQGAVYILHVKQRRYVLLDKHSREGTAVHIVSQPSRKLFVGFACGSIRVYDLSTHSHIATLNSHVNSILSLSADQGGKHILSGSADRVMLWDAATFQQRRALAQLQVDRIMAACADSTSLLALAHSSGHIALLDASTKQQQVTTDTPHCQGVTHLVPSSLTFTPDQQQLLCACRSPPVLLCYSSPGLQLLQVLHLVGSTHSILQVQALPDSKTAAVLLSTGRVVCVDLASTTITLQVQLPSTEARVNSFHIDARGNLLAACCSDGRARLYDLAALRAAGGRQAKQPAAAGAAAGGAGQQQQQRLLVERLSLQQVEELQAFAMSLLPPSAHSAPATGSGGQEDAAEGADADGCAFPMRPALQELPQNCAPTAAANPGVGGASKQQGPPGRHSGSKGAAGGNGGVQAQRLDALAFALNRGKLLQLLQRFGVFPQQHRPLIWAGLLRLPRQAGALAALVDRGVHPAYQQLAVLLPGTSPRLVGRLQGVLSQLAHWCPLFAEGGFLPRFAFPFVRVLGRDPLACFEGLATLLVNWSQGWFLCWPNPPVQLLRKLLALLAHHDAQLGGHLQRLQPSSLTFLWTQLSSCCSDLLPGGDWCRAWDHCIAQGPEWQYSLLLGWLLEVRGLLLEAADGAGLEAVVAAQPAVEVAKVIERAHQLHQATPGYMRLTTKPLTYLPAATPSSSTTSSSSGGVYPLFTEYPAGPVEVQRLERERLAAAEQALVKRRQVVAELEARSKQVSFESHALTAAREQLLALDQQRREAALSLEEAVVAAGAQLGDTAKAHRLHQVQLVEEAYKKSLASLKAQWGPELAALKAETERRRRLMALTIKSMQEEEDIKALEFQSRQRLWALEQDQLAAAAKSSMQDAAAAATAAVAAKQRAQAEQWAAEDRARDLSSHHDAARRAALVAQAENSAAQQAAAALLMQQELEAAENMAKVEHARQLRVLAEEEGRLTARQLELDQESARLRAAAAAQDLTRQADSLKAQFSQAQRARLDAIANEQSALAARQEALRGQVADLAAGGQLGGAAAGLGDLEALLAGADEVEALTAADLLLKVKRERKRAQQLQQQVQQLRAGHLDLSAPPAPAAGGGQAFSGRSPPRPSSPPSPTLQQAAAAAARARAVAAAADAAAEGLLQQQQGRGGQLHGEEAAGKLAELRGYADAAAEVVERLRSRPGTAGSPGRASVSPGRARLSPGRGAAQGGSGWQQDSLGGEGAMAGQGGMDDRRYDLQYDRQYNPHEDASSVATSVLVQRALQGTTSAAAAVTASPGYSEGGLGGSGYVRRRAGADAASSSTSSSNLTAEVEALLAEAEAEVHREDSDLREILAQAGLDAQVMGLTSSISSATGGGGGGGGALGATGRMDGQPMRVGRQHGGPTVAAAGTVGAGYGGYEFTAGSTKAASPPGTGAGPAAAAGTGRSGAVVSTAPPQSTTSRSKSKSKGSLVRHLSGPAAIAALQTVPEEGSEAARSTPRSKSTPGSKAAASPAYSASSSIRSGTSRAKQQQQPRAQQVVSPLSFHTASSNSAASSDRPGRYGQRQQQLQDGGGSSLESTPVKVNVAVKAGAVRGGAGSAAVSAWQARSAAAAGRGSLSQTAAAGAGQSQSLSRLPGGLQLGHALGAAPTGLSSSQVDSPLQTTNNGGASPSSLSSSSSSRGSSGEGEQEGAAQYGLYQPVLLGGSTTGATAGSGTLGGAYSQRQAGTHPSSSAGTTSTLSGLSADLTTAVAAATAAAAEAAARLAGAGSRGASAAAAAAAAAGRNGGGGSGNPGDIATTSSGSGGSLGRAASGASPDLWPLSSMVQGSNLAGDNLARGSLVQRRGPASSTSSGTSISSLGTFLQQAEAAAASLAVPGQQQPTGAAGSGGAGGRAARPASRQQNSRPVADALDKAAALAAELGIRASHAQQQQQRHASAAGSVDLNSSVGSLGVLRSSAAAASGKPASSTATSQELGVLLRQLSDYEQHLAQGPPHPTGSTSGPSGTASSSMGASSRGQLQQQQQQLVAGASWDLGSSVMSADGSLSWSQTLGAVEAAAGLKVREW